MQKYYQPCCIKIVKWFYPNFRDFRASISSNSTVRLSALESFATIARAASYNAQKGGPKAAPLARKLGAAYAAPATSSSARRTVGALAVVVGAELHGEQRRGSQRLRGGVGVF
jgi:hypothetical protein